MEISLKELLQFFDPITLFKASFTWSRNIAWPRQNQWNQNHSQGSTLKTRPLEHSGPQIHIWSVTERDYKAGETRWVSALTSNSGSWILLRNIFKSPFILHFEESSTFSLPSPIKMLMHNYYKTKEREDKRAILFKEMFHEHKMVIALIFAKTLFYVLLSETLFSISLL